MLTIKNWDKMIGESFVNDRFRCSNFEETFSNLSFWFKDLDDKIPAGGVWVTIYREGEYDPEKGHLMYNVAYPMCSPHRVGADWFSDIDNARWTFETALKDQ